MHHFPNPSLRKKTELIVIKGRQANINFLSGLSTWVLPTQISTSRLLQATSVFYFDLKRGELEINISDIEDQWNKLAIFWQYTWALSKHGLNYLPMNCTMIQTGKADNFSLVFAIRPDRSACEKINTIWYNCKVMPGGEQLWLKTIRLRLNARDESLFDVIFVWPSSNNKHYSQDLEKRLLKRKTKFSCLALKFK